MLENFTLLYVEDDKDTVENIKEIVEPLVKEFYVAYDGEEGLEVYNEVSPDIVLTDINMPKLNGIEMSKKIKEINYKQSIIVLTAFNENRLLHDSVDLGVDGYITKPIVDIKKLLEPIEKSAQRLQNTIDKKNLENLLEIQGKTAAIGEMIGNIAHQWRQPLSIISLQASNIIASVELDEHLSKDDLLKASNDMIKQTLYLSQTIDDFRDFLKADISVKTLINIKNTLSKVKDLVKANLKNNDIKLITDLEDIEILGNENQLIQSIINVLNNAKDAIVQNSCESRYIFISLKKDNNNNIVISILDSGGGIDEDIKEKIFEPYFTTKHQSLGTGIGLYITFKTITKVFDGKIRVENKSFTYNDENLKGAQFIITLPIKEKS